MVPTARVLKPPPPVRYASAPAAPVTDPFENNFLAKLLLLVLLADVFFNFSRFLEFVAIRTGHILPIATPCRLAGVLGVLVAGRFYPAILSRLGICFLLFTGWLILATPTSSWKGGSVGMLLHVWIPSYLAFFVSSSILSSMKGVKRALYVIAFSSVIILATSPFEQGDIGGRFSMGAGTLGNANDFAMYLLLGIPPMLLFAQLQRRRYFAIKLMFAAAIPLFLLMVGKTASRGAILLLLFLVIWYFTSASSLGKLKVAAVSTVLLAFFFMAAPASSLARFKTVIPFLHVSGSADEDLAGTIQSAEESSASRKMMFNQSLALTLRHPVFGVGPGAFEIASAHDAEERGQRAMWLETHNAYTQVSSEAGIPAFLFYAGALIVSIMTARRIRKQTRRIPELDELSKVSFCLLGLLGLYTISGFFGSIAYLPLFPFMAGITEAFRRLATTQIEGFQAGKMAPAAVPGRR